MIQSVGIYQDFRNKIIAYFWYHANAYQPKNYVNLKILKNFLLFYSCNSFFSCQYIHISVFWNFLENNNILQFDSTDCFQTVATRFTPMWKPVKRIYVFFTPRSKRKLTFWVLIWKDLKKIRLQKPRIGPSNNMNCPNRTSKKSLVVSQKWSKFWRFSIDVKVVSKIDVERIQI